MGSINVFTPPPKQTDEPKSFWKHISEYEFKKPELHFNAIKLVPLLLFLTLLGVLYIANNYNYLQHSGELQQVERDIEKLRIEYGTLNYEYINAGKREEIERRTEGMGLQLNQQAPVVIETAPFKAEAK
jgi:cell division protein FtsL